jgi:hypothetical protein
MTKVRQVYADEATVLVWENVATLAIATGLGRPGHAAVMVRRDNLPALAQKEEQDRQKRESEICFIKMAVNKTAGDLDDRMIKLDRLVGKLEPARGAAALKAFRNQELYNAALAVLRQFPREQAEEAAREPD